MKNVIILPAILLTVFIGCRKNESVPAPQPYLPPDDARTVLLKEVVAQSLPSPYFQFVHDDRRYVKQINFASGFAIYNLEYENKRVKKMTNIQNNNSLFYSYSNEQVSEINEFSTNANGHLFKKAVLAYQADGNLSTIESYFDISGGPLSLEKTDRFSD